MEWIVLVTLLVAAEYFFLTIMVGKSRSETGISAPKISGNEKFERVFRVQQMHRRAVDQAQRVVVIDDDNAFAQVLNDVLVELGQILQIDATLARQCFADLYAARERSSGNGHCKRCSAADFHHTRNRPVLHGKKLSKGFNLGDQLGAKRLTG